MSDRIAERLSRIVTMTAGAVALLVAAGCTEAAGPAFARDSYELPAPDPSLDPDRLSVGEPIATPCAFGLYGDRLAGLLERHEWVLVDIFFGQSSPIGLRPGPTEGDVSLVESHGGRVLHRFNIPAVRARILLSRLPGLVEEGFWITVRDVPDETRYDVEILTGLTHAIRETDIDRFASLGGRIIHRWQSINGLGGILPDRSIPAWRDGAVRYVEPNSVGCFG